MTTTKSMTFAATMLCAVLSFGIVATGFIAPIPRTTTVMAGAATTRVVSPPSITLGMSSSDDDAPAAAATGGKKRRKRKDGKSFATESVETAPADPTPEPSAPAFEQKADSVVMEVRDIRDILSGNEPAPAEAAPTTTTTTADDDDELADDEEWEYLDDDEDELADDEEWEYYDVDDDGVEITAAATVSTGANTKRRSRTGGARGYIPDGGTKQGYVIRNKQAIRDSQALNRRTADGMETLLSDARQMRAEDDSDIEEEGDGIRAKIFDVISTVVTVDFFVVLALLLWFLAGIFCATVLGDTTVQILFNNNFEKVTLPALAILMVGSAAGAIGREPEEEEQ